MNSGHRKILKSHTPQFPKNFPIPNMPLGHLFPNYDVNNNNNKYKNLRYRDKQF
uniref:Uncharacterized protein n=1 Tax=Rhizophora mucronata TaxID=61149 RepID=A0A2P2PQ96_RHIMU